MTSTRLLTLAVSALLLCGPALAQPVESVARRDTQPTGPVGAAGRLAGRVGTLRTARPSTSGSSASNRAASVAWARSAQAAGVHTLVISFEGLWSFSQAYADKVYAYQAALRRGERPTRPRRASMSFLAKELLVPSLRRHHSEVELLLLPETSENREFSVARECARAWRQVHGSALRLLVLGHSFGGYSALRLAKRLKADGTRVSAMLTVDARTTPGNYRHFTRPSNVQAHHNFFRKGFMPGYSIEGAVNQRLRGVSHGTIPGAPEVKRRWEAMLGE